MTNCILFDVQHTSRVFQDDAIGERNQNILVLSLDVYIDLFFVNIHLKKAVYIHTTIFNRF